MSEYRWNQDKGWERIIATCHKCGKTGYQSEMWDDGPPDQPGTVYICQMCHEAEVDADFWEIVTTHPGIW